MSRARPSTPPKGMGRRCSTFPWARRTAVGMTSSGLRHQAHVRELLDTDRTRRAKPAHFSVTITACSAPCGPYASRFRDHPQQRRHRGGGVDSPRGVRAPPSIQQFRIALEIFSRKLRAAIDAQSPQRGASGPGRFCVEATACGCGSGPVSGCVPAYSDVRAGGSYPSQRERAQHQRIGLAAVAAAVPFLRADVQFEAVVSRMVFFVARRAASRCRDLPGRSGPWRPSQARAPADCCTVYVGPARQVVTTPSAGR